MFFAFIVAVACLGVALSSPEAEIYKCSLCISSVERIISNNIVGESFADSCKATFPLDSKDFCSVLPSRRVSIVDGDARKTCMKENLCPSETEPWQTRKANSGALDVRVSKALGSRDYNKVRLSVIANHTITSDLFSYTSDFKYRWTSNSLIGDLKLNTGIVSVNPGKKTSFTIEGQTVEIFVPAENEGTRGIILADPCFQSQWITCVYQTKFDTFKRLTEILNAAMEFDDLHFFQILGDNFYDQDGEATAAIFDALSLKTKSKLFSTVPGNHDFWVHGSPSLYTSKDHQGNGFMQFYGQDVLAARAADDALPFDFSVDPDGPNKGRFNLPPASNFFFYNKVGNIAMIGWSGAHSFGDQTGLFDEACAWATATNPDVVLLLTHWNSDGMGCDSTSTAPAVYKELSARPACANLSSKMRYFMGHTHCNLVTEPDVGYMVGAWGMSDTSCSAATGFPVVDTTGGTFKVYYFPIQEANKFDNYDTILSCVKAKGFSGCYDLATKWTVTDL